MSLQYPLLFPYGEDGYRIDLNWVTNHVTEQSSRKRISMRAFYCYQLQQRLDQGNTLFRSGRLFQQYLVDAYASVEEDRLDYIRKNQKTLRSEIYQGIQDAVLKGDTDANAIGKRIILPSSHTGSPRYMIQNYQDAMAICRQYGNPDLFITFTCNPKWPEIIRALSIIPGQKPEDRPDIIARIFKMKLNEMLATIKSGTIFGKIIADLYVVEFQKRGLPHCHFLFWLHPEEKIREPSQIDKLISAEIPNPKEDPLGYNIVAEFMMHGPCGLAKTNAQCMKNSICSKKFPKQIRNETIIEENGIINYKRRNTNYYVEKENIKLDNRFVVLYNIELCLKFCAHINTEICSQSVLIKYLFKYLAKGPDRVRAILEDNIYVDSFGHINYQEID